MGLLSDSGAAAMSRPSRAEALRARRRRQVGRPASQVGGTRRYAASMAAPAQAGPGPSSVPGILSPGKTHRHLPYGRGKTEACCSP